MNKPHKFKHGSNGNGTYDHVIFCEYCGIVVFYANRPDESKVMQEKASDGCPCAPDIKSDD